MKRFEKMKFFGTIAIALILLSCGGGDGGDSELKQLIPDGKYRLSKIKYGSGETINISTQGDLYFSVKWLGNRKYKIIEGGKGTLTYEDSPDSVSIDCSSPDINEMTLDENDNIINLFNLESGCVRDGYSDTTPVEEVPVEPDTGSAEPEEVPVKAKEVLVEEEEKVKSKIIIIENGFQIIATVYIDDENSPVTTTTSTYMKI